VLDQSNLKDASPPVSFKDFGTVFDARSKE